MCKAPANKGDGALSFERRVETCPKPVSGCVCVDRPACREAAKRREQEEVQQEQTKAEKWRASVEESVILDDAERFPENQD
jgi:hypothetical protein